MAALIGTRLSSFITNAISTLGKVLGITAYIWQFVSNIKNKLNRETGPLTATELHIAKMKWVKDCQQQVYYNEFTNMHSASKKRLPLVRQLCLFIDDQGFIQCDERIHNAPLCHTTKFLAASKTPIYIDDHLHHSCQVISH